MTNRNPNITFYTVIIGLFCLSFGYNIHLWNRIKILESNLTFSRCGTSEYELTKIREEIKRLELDSISTQSDTKSVLVK